MYSYSTLPNSVGSILASWSVTRRRISTAISSKGASSFSVSVSGVRWGVQQLQQPRCALLNRILVSARHVAHVHPGAHMGLEVPAAQLGEDLGHVVRQEPVAHGVVLRSDLGDLPAWQVGVNAVQEGWVLQLDGQPLEQVLVPGFWLPQFQVRVDIPPKDDRAWCGELLVAPTTRCIESWQVCRSISRPSPRRPSPIPCHEGVRSRDSRAAFRPRPW